MFGILFILLSIAQVHAVRVKRRGNKTQSGLGYVDRLYTYGAPKVSSPALSNPLAADGCFPGWRIVNKNNKWYELQDNVDLVPTLLGQVTGYSHVLMPSQFLDQNGVSTNHFCGWENPDWRFPNLILHFWWYYVSRSEPNPDAGVRTAAVIGLDNSYDSDENRVASKVGAYGWNVVSMIKTGLSKEVVHLMQNPRTNACILTFKGSDTIEDFVNDIVVVTDSFCGLKERVHRGFKWELMNTVQDDAFQTTLRPLLGQCSKLEVLGHSLGGATASLFTACLHNRVPRGEIGYDDYRWISFTRQRSRMLPALGQMTAANFTVAKAL